METVTTITRRKQSEALNAVDPDHQAALCFAAFATWLRERPGRRVTLTHDATGFRVDPRGSANDPRTNAPRRRRACGNGREQGRGAAMTSLETLNNAIAVDELRR